MNLRQAKKLLEILGLPLDIMYESWVANDTLVLQYQYISDDNLLERVKKLIPNVRIDNLTYGDETEPFATFIIVENTSFFAASYIAEKTTGMPFSFLIYITDKMLRPFKWF